MDLRAAADLGFSVRRTWQEMRLAGPVPPFHRAATRDPSFARSAAGRRPCRPLQQSAGRPCLVRKPGTQGRTPCLRRKPPGTGPRVASRPTLLHPRSHRDGLLTNVSPAFHCANPDRDRQGPPSGKPARLRQNQPAASTRRPGQRRPQAFGWMSPPTCSPRDSIRFRARPQRLPDSAPRLRSVAGHPEAATRPVDASHPPASKAQTALATVFGVPREIG